MLPFLVFKFSIQCQDWTKNLTLLASPWTRSYISYIMIWTFTDSREMGFVSYPVILFSLPILLCTYSWWLQKFPNAFVWPWFLAKNNFLVHNHVQNTQWVTGIACDFIQDPLSEDNTHLSQIIIEKLEPHQSRVWVVIGMDFVLILI